ncbi:DUF2147 domain-containing protein [Sphingomicrobium lutaoense]|uniref:Uncharacterized protein (DUF2147 family) n=1 Tax=Sphingomicrobium lutaoense TaxID=515949 RepID=A0A839Z324_9SPHN|nr:DUF2147 domain-containing protein [Sphingomicrobium lutaoense]MBB3764948.1 uncharacterized protein (DUF2147 family) [Sphingomicrobium lutaoense]
MKKWIPLGLLALLAAPASAGSPHPLDGKWKEGNLVIDIAPCGPAMCGTVVSASEKQKERARKGSGINLVGSRLITDIQPDGPNRYKAKVFVADRNMNASGRIEQISSDRIKVRGCVVLGIFCKSEEWRRVGN